MPRHLDNGLAELKEQLLLMASHAEAAVNRAVRAIIRRDDDLARRIREDDTLLDRLEVEIDETAIRLLGQQPGPEQLRLITTAMKISHDLERVGDEATSISRRCLELSREAPLAESARVPVVAAEVLPLLKEALDSFVNRDPAKARQLIPRDEAIDQLHKQLHAELAQRMANDPRSVTRCLNLMVISKCLERIGDHAKNVAEMVVYLYEGRDIRHPGRRATRC